MRGGQVLDVGSKGTLVKMLRSAPESYRESDWGIVRKAGKSFHRLVARSDLASQVYFWVMPHISRRLWPAVQQRLRNSINSVDWPNIALRPRSVTLGNHTEVLLCPHLKEFDIEAALSRRLDYEQEVFAFLETRMMRYGSVIEVGANVGVFTLFFAKRLTGKTGPGNIFAFEPSRQAYQRLLQNLEINQISNVVPFNCAVGSRLGLFPFFEPAGHLTNGSLDADLARHFASAVNTLPVLVVDGSFFESLPGLQDPVLLKIDAEGSEAPVLSSLEHFIRSHRPDVVIEVLPQYEAKLNAVTFLKRCGYRFFNIAPTGLVAQEGFVAKPSRDYFMTANS